MSSKGILLALLLGAACGLAAAWALSGPDSEASTQTLLPGDDAPAAPDLATRSAPSSARGSMPDTPTEPSLAGDSRAADRYDEALRRNEALETRSAELEERIVELEPKAVDPAAFRFDLPAKVPTFDAADWPTLAGHMLELTKIVGAVRDEVLTNGRPSAKTIEVATKHNMPLAQFAVALGPEIGEASPNIAYTHPAVIANLIRASLQQAGDPLGRDQELAISVLGNAWERELVRGVVPPGSPELGGLVAEVDAKLRFLSDVKDVLSTSQRVLLFQPETEGRQQIDLLSPALVYTQRLPFAAVDRADLETKLLEQLFQQAGVEVESLDPYSWVARRWVDEMPGVLTPRSRMSEDIIFPHVDQLQMMTKAQVRATERILGMGRLEEGDAERVRAVTWALHPYVSPEASEPSVPESD